MGPETDVSGQWKRELLSNFLVNRAVFLGSWCLVSADTDMSGSQVTFFFIVRFNYEWTIQIFISFSISLVCCDVFFGISPEPLRRTLNNKRVPQKNKNKHYRQNFIEYAINRETTLQAICMHINMLKRKKKCIIWKNGMIPNGRQHDSY